MVGKRKARKISTIPTNDSKVESYWSRKNSIPSSMYKKMSYVQEELKRKEKLH